VSLHDSRFNFMDYPEPAEFRYLNFDPNYLDWGFINDEDPQFTILISLSNRVVVQRRIVYDVLTMFGDVGGLNDFLEIGLATAFSFVAGNLMTASMVKSLFRITHKDGGRKQMSKSLKD